MVHGTGEITGPLIDTSQMQQGIGNVDRRIDLPLDLQCPGMKIQRGLVASLLLIKIAQTGITDGQVQAVPRGFTELQALGKIGFGLGEILHFQVYLTDAVQGIAGKGVSILTGGPGCGKTTATRVLVSLLEAMKRRVMLAAPTGRAAQRMGEVVGR